MNKTLVAYFSASGVTARTAKSLAQAVGADLYEIRPAVPYTSADLDWRNAQSRSSLEMRDKSSRPALADREAEIGKYDTIFVGFPIWWGIAPTIINTFLEAYDFSGKTVIPFATSGGSGFGRAGASIQTSARGAVVKPGKLLNAAQSAQSLRRWAESLEG